MEGGCLPEPPHSFFKPNRKEIDREKRFEHPSWVGLNSTLSLRKTSHHQYIPTRYATRFNRQACDSLVQNFNHTQTKLHRVELAGETTLTVTMYEVLACRAAKIVHDHPHHDSVAQHTQCNSRAGSPQPGEAASPATEAHTPYNLLGFLHLGGLFSGSNSRPGAPGTDSH